MPATFPSHAAAVVPLKLWRPRWFDGVALVIGSMAPDLAYALDSTWLEHPVRRLPPLWSIAHSWWGVLVWCLPVTLACGLIVRRSAASISVHLPGWLRDFGAIGRGPAWCVTAGSAILGAASHVVWDRLAVGVADPISTVIGAVIAIGVVIHIGRSGRLREWHGPPPRPPRRPLVFWGVTILVFVCWLPFLRAPLPHTWIPRTLIAAGTALAIGALAVSRQPPPTRPS